MWIDEHGSDVLGLPECRQLLAVAARAGRHGHVGVPRDGAPLVLPVDYAVVGHDVLVQVGDRLAAAMEGRLVAFQVDGVDEGCWAAADAGPWSVLVCGLAMADDGLVPCARSPEPRTAIPGNVLVRIRADVVTGRRIQSTRQAEPGPDALR